MSDATIERAGGAARFAAGRVRRGWRPVHAWSARRRAAVAGAIAAASCGLAVAGCVVADVAGVAAARAALADARRGLADAQRAQRELPALRQAASAARHGVPAESDSDSADVAHRVSALAAASGISLVSLEPGAAAGHGNESFRSVKLVAQGDFMQLREFLRGLAGAPTLIVPVEATVKRDGTGLSIVTTLSVYDSLPSLPDIVGRGRVFASADPFAAGRAGGAQAHGPLRLAGLMLDRAHAVALVERPDGTDTVQTGERIDGERVVRIGAAGVTLSDGGTARLLTWAENAR